MIPSILKDMNLNTISPLDGRYTQEAKPLLEYFSEEANLKYMTRVESALLNEHLLRHNIPEIGDVLVSPQIVYSEEQITRHQVKALVECIRRGLLPKYQKFVHLGITSSDTQDTANAMRIRDAMNMVIIPVVDKLIQLLIDKMESHWSIPQIGRTHGQWAVPMTCGWWFAEYVSRLGRAADRLYPPLFGNMSGAVGTYRALSYIYENPREFARSVLNRLGLELPEYSSQILPTDDLVQFLGSVNVCFGIIANLADDIRNLQRSEISEVEERFFDGQVGSSTMPHKHNPWNSEHVKSLWKEFMPRYITFSMDLISDHQRDLTGSASSRFVFEYLTGFYLAVNRMCQVVKDLQINVKTMKKRASGFDDTEKAYILLALAGVSNAHKFVQGLVEEARNFGRRGFKSLLMKSEYWDKIKDIYDKVGEDVIQEMVHEIAQRHRRHVEACEACEV